MIVSELVSHRTSANISHPSSSHRLTKGGYGLGLEAVTLPLTKHLERFGPN